MVGGRSKAAVFPCFSDNRQTKRVVAQKWQTNALKASFRKSAHADQTELDRLGKKTELTATWIKSWFMRERRKQKQNRTVLKAPTSEPSPEPSISGDILLPGSPSYGEYSGDASSDYAVSSSSLLATPSSFCPLTPLLGHLPLGLSTIDKDTTMDESLDHELFALDFFETPDGELDFNLGSVSVEDHLAVTQTDQQLQSAGSHPHCKQILSQGPKPLVSEATAPCFPTYDHDYSSSSQAGTAVQSSLYTRDVPDDFMSTAPFQPAYSTLEPVQTSPSVTHQQSTTSKGQPYPPLPVAMLVKLTDLMKISRRTTDKYIAATQIKESTGKGLFGRVPSEQDSREGNTETIALLQLPQTAAAAKDTVGEDTDDEGDEAITPSTSSSMLSPLTANNVGKVPNDGVFVLDNGGMCPAY